jgi:hypothetical protein
MAGRIAYYGNIVKDGLVLDLDAAKKDSYPGTGTVWRDVSGNGYTGSLTNGPTFSSTNGGSVVFDGTNDYVTLGTPSILNGVQVPLTICGWGYLNSISGNRTLYGVYANTGGGNIYSMIRTDSGTLKYYASNSGGAFQSQGTFNIAINTWYFYAAVVSGSLSSPNVTIYRNNSSESFSYGTFTSTPALNVDFRVGGNQAQPFSEGWSGNIPSIQIYNRALSASEVTQNYNALKGRFGL